MIRLQDNEGLTIGCKEIGIESTGVLSKERARILQLLSEGPSYPAEIARKMDLPVQTIYYHIRMLEKGGFIDFVEYRERNGGVAKQYRAKAASFAFIADQSAWKKTASPVASVPSFLAPFVADGFFDGMIVVGSPDPHGRYRARASELGVLELAMLLGRYAPPAFPLYTLDTQAGERDKGKNMILAGGPKVNTLVAAINDKLPIRFERDFAEIFSAISKKTYMGNVGIVESVRNPFNPEKTVLVVGGLNHHGTRAAVLAIVKKTEELDMGNQKKPKLLAKVVEGFDEDGDGKIDAVEILE